MDIKLIEQAIIDLENSETTSANVKELACLYIIMDKINSAVKTVPEPSEKELVDILPAYSRYQAVKRNYQITGTSEDALLPVLNLVMQELEEFVLILYTNTHFRKERQCICDSISNITNKLSKL